MFFENGDEQIDTDGNPYLGLDGILRLTKENLYVKVLLDPLEKKLHLPTLLVKLGNGQRLELEVVCEKD